MTTFDNHHCRKASTVTSVSSGIYFSMFLLRKPIDLDMVRHYLDKGCYKRLDIFQDHIFEVFERARGLTRTDSQVTGHHIVSVVNME